MKSNLRREMPLHLMLLIPAFFLLVYSYLPMLGIIIAFQDFFPSNKGFVYSIFHSKFIGLDIFKYLAIMPDMYQITWKHIEHCRDENRRQAGLPNDIRLAAQ